MRGCSSCRGFLVSWRVWVVVVGLVLAGCGDSGGAAEDRHRLEVVSGDPAAALEPPDVVSSEPPEEFLATTDNGQLQGCCNSGVGVDFMTGAEPAAIMRSYADELARVGWSDIVVDCRTLTSQVSALKQFDTFVARFRAEVSHTGPPHHLFQSVNGRYHTDDYPAPTGAQPDLSCLDVPEN